MAKRRARKTPRPANGARPAAPAAPPESRRDILLRFGLSVLAITVALCAAAAVVAAFASKFTVVLLIAGAIAIGIGGIVGRMTPRGAPLAKRRRNSLITAIIFASGLLSMLIAVAWDFV